MPIPPHEKARRLEKNGAQVPGRRTFFYLPWHDRSHHSPMHQWFRGLVMQSRQSVAPPMRRRDPR
jgi:DNA-binding transcriptional LysR family regulator